MQYFAKRFAAVLAAVAAVALGAEGMAQAQVTQPPPEIPLPCVQHPTESGFCPWYRPYPNDGLTWCTYHAGCDHYDKLNNFVCNTLTEGARHDWLCDQEMGLVKALPPLPIGLFAPIR